MLFWQLKTKNCYQTHLTSKTAHFPKFDRGLKLLRPRNGGFRDPNFRENNYSFYIIFDEVTTVMFNSSHSLVLKRLRTRVERK